MRPWGTSMWEDEGGEGTLAPHTRIQFRRVEPIPVAAHTDLEEDPIPVALIPSRARLPQDVRNMSLQRLSIRQPEGMPRLPRAISQRQRSTSTKQVPH